MRRWTIGKEAVGRGCGKGGKRERMEDRREEDRRDEGGRRMEEEKVKGIGKRQMKVEIRKKRKVWHEGGKYGG